MTKRVALYLRCSTEEQTTENQKRQLEEVAARSGWTVVKVYEDYTSGAKAAEDRKALSSLLKEARRRRFDLVMCWSVDRLGRSVANVSAVMAELESLGVGQFYLQQAIDSQTPSGKAMLHMCLVFAEMERGILSERVKAGMARAKDSGKHVGRPPLSGAVKARVLALRSEGRSFRKIATELDVSLSSVTRTLAEAR